MDRSRVSTRIPIRHHYTPHRTMGPDKNARARTQKFVLLLPWAIHVILTKIWGIVEEGKAESTELVHT